MRSLFDPIVPVLVAVTAAMAVVLAAAEAPASAAPVPAPSRHTAVVWQSGASNGDADKPGRTQSMTGQSYRVYLPMVFGGQGSTCSVQSPFSIEIAALHQVGPNRGAAHSAESMTGAEWWALYRDQFPSLTEALKASGACWSRVRVDWSTIQPEPPPAGYVWGSYHDERLRLVAETGVRLIAIVDGVPGWAGDSVYGPIDPDRLDEFSQFLTAVVTRYKAPPYNIHHWELFNEPDLTAMDGAAAGWGYEGDRYAQMLAVAYPAIKAADSQATVLMGGLAHDWFTEYDGPFFRYFPDDVMSASGGEYMDAVNFHYFPDYAAEWERWDPNSKDRRNGWLPAPTCGTVDDDVGTAYTAGGIDLMAKVSHVRNRLATCFGLNKPVWVTELGEHGYAGDPASLAQQTRYVIQGYARGLASGVQNITWFALVSPPYDPFDQGLLYQDDWSPKPAYYAYQTMVRELSDYTYAYMLEAQGVEGYVFRSGQQLEKIIAWSRYPMEPATLTLADASRLRVVDRSGNVSFVEDGGPSDLDGAVNGKVSLRMTADPVFISR